MCSNEIYNNANWTSIQTGQTSNGTCISNYYGLPMRKCILNGTNGYWSVNVTNPCNGYLKYPILSLFYLFSLFSINSYHVFK